MGLSIDLGSFGNGARRGAKRDYRYYKKRDAYDWARARERGLSPQEFYGSPAAGNTPDSANTQVLGNQSTALMQMAGQLGSEAVQKAKDRKNAKEIAKIQSEATMYAADQSRQASQDQVVGNIAVQELQNVVQNRQIDLKERELEEISLKAAEQNIQLTKKQIQLAANEIANTAPDWVKKRIIMQMGVDNSLQTFILARHKINLSKPEDIQNMTDEQYQEVLTTLLGYNSAIGKELRGLGLSAKDLVKKIMSLDWTIPESDITGPQRPSLGSAPR